jgi:hypothetical protein
MLSVIPPRFLSQVWYGLIKYFLPNLPYLLLCRLAGGAHAPVKPEVPCGIDGYVCSSHPPPPPPPAGGGGVLSTPIYLILGVLTD